MKFNRSVLGLAAVAMLALVAVPAQAEDSLLQQLKSVSNQNVTLDDQWNVGVQWAESDYGKITETLSQVNAGVIADFSASVSLDDCNCFNDVTSKVNIDAKQTLLMDDQINGGLQVALTNADIKVDMTQTNVGAALSGATDILSTP